MKSNIIKYKKLTAKFCKSFRIICDLTMRFVVPIPFVKSAGKRCRFCSSGKEDDVCLNTRRFGVFVDKEGVEFWIAACNENPYLKQITGRTPIDHIQDAIGHYDESLKSLKNSLAKRKMWTGNNDPNDDATYDRDEFVERDMRVSFEKKKIYGGSTITPEEYDAQSKASHTKYMETYNDKVHSDQLDMSVNMANALRVWREIVRNMEEAKVKFSDFPPEKKYGMYGMYD